MFNLITRDHTNELNEIDKLFDDAFNQFTSFKPFTTTRFKPAKSINSYINTHKGMDIYSDDSNYFVECEAPGITKDEVNLEINDGLLKINIEKKKDTEEKTKDYILKGRSTFKSFKSIPITEDMDQNNISASLKDGLLKLSIPKITKKETKQIKIDVK